MKLAASIVAALLLWGATAAEAEVMSKTVTYEHDGVVLEGYVAWNDAVEGPRPGVLIVHQWMGLTDYERMRANMLAELGYTAFAADIYGKGVRPTNTSEASTEAGKYYDDRSLFRGRLAAGLAELRRQPDVDPARVAAIGYCFGGGGALELARSGAKLAGVVSFHGTLDTPLRASKGDIQGTVLVCAGAMDPYVKRESVNAFIDEMENADVDYEVILYAHAVHSFTQKAAGDDPSKGAAYNAAADRRSWRAMRDLFDEIF